MEKLDFNLGIIDGLNPSDLWNFFAILSSFDRGSGREGAISAYICGLASRKGCEYKQDKLKNLIVYVPATKGLENRPSLGLQVHLDMVPANKEKTDFDTSSIEFMIEGGRLKAKETSLGADNGIAVALLLCIMDDEDLKHGPLELIFTVDEERGMLGVKKLDSEWIKSKFLINLDSEEDGEVTLGCAGGGMLKGSLPIAFMNFKPDYDFKVFDLRLFDLESGHSGLHIGLGRANAIIEMAGLLGLLLFEYKDILVMSFDGGNIINIIPSQSYAKIIIPSGLEDEITLKIRKIESDLQKKYFETDKNLQLTFKLVEDQSNINLETCFKPEFTANLLSLILSLPNGAIEFDPADSKVMQTSNNVAIIRTLESGKIILDTFYRSSSNESLARLKKEITEIMLQVDSSEVKPDNEYPAWPPRHDSFLLKYVASKYQEVFSAPIKTNVTHGGLELSFFSERFPEVEMVSLGPDIKDPHSIKESVSISSVSNFCELMFAILADFE